MATITDADGRDIRVYAGQIGDDPVALVEVASRADTSRPVVRLWLCADQIEELATAMRERQQEAVETW